MKPVNLRNAFRFFKQNYFLKAFTSFSSIQIIGAIASLFILSIFTRLLAPEDFARITFIMIIVVILATIIDSGLNTAFSIRFYKVSEIENRKNIYSCLIYYPFVLTVVYSVFFLFPVLSEKFFKVEMMISQRFYIYLLILTTSVGKFFTNFLMISKKPKLFFITNIFFYLTVIAVGWMLIQVIKTGYFAYVYAYLSGYGFLTIAGIFYFLKLYRPSKDFFSKENLKSLLRLGFPLVPNSLLLMLLTYADRYILGMFTGLAAVGIYSAGYLFV